MNKRGPSARGSETAARILKSADELLGEFGYDQTSMRLVAERAGVQKALVFYYFKSKSELFDCVLERYYEKHLAVLRLASSAEGTIYERLHRVIDAYFDFVVENLRYPRLVQQLVSGSDEHTELIQRSLSPLFEHVVHLLEEVAPGTGALAAKQFFVTISGTVINYFTFAPALHRVWGSDPMAPESLADRRAHVHWLIDATAEKLLREAPQGSSSTVQLD